jgi:hypothetical protein
MHLLPSLPLAKPKPALLSPLFCFLFFLISLLGGTHASFSLLLFPSFLSRTQEHGSHAAAQSEDAAATLRPLHRTEARSCASRRPFLSLLPSIRFFYSPLSRSGCYFFLLNAINAVVTSSAISASNRRPSPSSLAL